MGTKVVELFLNKQKFSSMSHLFSQKTTTIYCEKRIDFYLKKLF
jgi:hypothetical protein